MSADLKEAFDVAISLGGVINTLWQFYLTVMVAIVAGLLFSKTQLKTSQQKTIATIAFVLFALFNLSVLSSTYEVFNAALEEVRAQAEKGDSADFKGESLRGELSTIAIAPSWVPVPISWIPIVVHVIADLVVLLLIWRNPLSSADVPKNTGSINTTERSS
jgi:hypothetical protein